MTDTPHPDDPTQPIDQPPAGPPSPSPADPAQSPPPAAPSAADVPPGQAAPSAADVPPGRAAGEQPTHAAYAGPAGSVPPGQAPPAAPGGVPYGYGQPPAAPQQRWWGRRVPILLAAALLLIGCILGAGVVAVGAVVSHFGDHDRGRPGMRHDGYGPGWGRGDFPRNRDGRGFPPGPRQYPFSPAPTPSATS